MEIKSASEGFDFGLNGVTSREWLILALRLTMSAGQARVVVDALDAYLAEGPDHRAVFTFENLTPDLGAEIEKLRGERDAMIALAEQAVQTVTRALDELKKSVPPPVEQKIGAPNGKANE